MVKCAECGKPIINCHYLDGKIYGHECFKRALALKMVKFTDNHNALYNAKCVAAMAVYAPKKSSRFHDSICQQWNDCGKLTSKQLSCVKDSFNTIDKMDYYGNLFTIFEQMPDDAFACKDFVDREDCYKTFILWFFEYTYGHRCEFYEHLFKNRDFFSGILNCAYPQGYYFAKEDGQIFVRAIGSLRCERTDNMRRHYTKSEFLIEDLDDEDIEILDIIKPKNLENISVKYSVARRR